MERQSWVTRMDRWTKGFSRSLEWIGVVGFLLMFLANFVDVVGAKLFNWPLPGVTEIISFSQVVAIASTLAITLIIGQHIRVEFIVDLFPKRLRGGVTAVGSFLSLVIFVLILWQSFRYGQTLQIGGEIGSSVPIPFYPFAYFIAFSCIPVCLVLLMEMIHSLKEAFGNGPC